MQLKTVNVPSISFQPLPPLVHNTRRNLSPTLRCKSSSLTVRAEDEDKAHSSREGSDWKLPLAGSDTDWRAFRARLVAGESAETPAASGQESQGEGWAHAIAQPERGCLVIAHPLMFKNHQQYFDQAVILLINHDDSGTAGLILNKPLQHLVGSLAGAEMLRPEFDKNPLFMGGDVGGHAGENTLQLLHNQKQFERSIEIVDGVYMGGYEAARMAVRRDELDPLSTCRWYCRYCGWAPGQLRSEIEQGVWFTVAASKDLIFHPDSLAEGKKHWHAVMQKMGGEYKELSDAIEVDPNVNYLQQMVDAEKQKEQRKDEDSS